MRKIILVLLAVLLIFTGCGNPSEPAPITSEPASITSEPEQTPSDGEQILSKLEQIKAAGKLTVFTNAEFPPFEYMEGNEIIGVDIEIAKAIAVEIGVELEMVNANFDGIVASIASGRGDLGISGFTITDDRKKEVDFSVPYVDSVQYMIIPDGSDLAVLEDFEGKSVGAQLGTTGEMLVQEEIDEGVLMDKKTEVKPYQSAPLAMADLAIGRIAAVVIDELVAINLAREKPGYLAIPLVYKSGAPFTEQFGVALKKGQDDLLDVVNRVVSDMVNRGIIEQLIEQYS